jgi:Zn-finger nucleic acid-binding protein
MNCPVCNVPMVVLEMDLIEIDHCLKCGGVWLDAEEMDLLLDGSEGREEIRRRAMRVDDSPEEKRRCPICDKKMEKARVTREGKDIKILIDRCEEHHGTWLDGGELDAVIKLSSFPEAHKIHVFLRSMFGGDQSPPR